MNKKPIHTKGCITFKEDAEANQYAMLDRNGHWLMSILHNGEALTEVQKANFSRLAECWNACLGMSDKEISEGLVAIKHYAEMVKKRDQLEAALSATVDQRDEAIGKISGISSNIDKTETLKAELPSLNDEDLVKVITVVSEEVASRMMGQRYDTYVVSKIRIAESFPADMENGLDEARCLAKEE